jgi:hypothetical protein
MLPGAAARAPIKQASDARSQGVRPSSPRALPFQARHSKSRLFPEPSATLNAAGMNESPATGNALFPRPSSFNCGVGADGGGASAAATRMVDTTSRADSLCLWGEAGARCHAGWPLI